mgnify:CR=1 FL=1
MPMFAMMFYDLTLAEELQKLAQNEDFIKNVNKEINTCDLLYIMDDENAPMLAIDKVKVNSFFRNNKINNFTCYSVLIHSKCDENIQTSIVRKKKTSKSF